jgi:carbamoyl-phosphate synthase large subunit
MRAAQRVASALGLHYLHNIQFRRDAQGQPRLLEINPRIPGTISLTVQAGLNLPLYAFCMALGGRPPALPSPEVGLTVLRHHGNVYARDMSQAWEP